MPFIPPPPPRPATANVTAPIWLAAASYTVDSGTTLYADGVGTIFRAENAYDIDFTNNGFIWSRAESYPGLFAAQIFGRIVNNGIMVSEGAGNTQVHGISPGRSTSITNNGSIYAISRDYGAALAIQDYASFTPSLILNNGIIASQSGIDGASYAILRNNGGPVHNLPGGSILAEGGFAGAVRLDRGTFGTATGPVEVVNEGLIEAVSLAPGSKSYGIGGSNTAGERLDIINSGTIRAYYAITMSERGGDFPQYWGRQTVTNLSTGLLDGRVFLGDGDDTLINHGRITGLIDLGSGNDEYRGADARQSVVVNGGSGNDLITSGMFADLLTGGQGTDVYRGTVAGLTGDTIADLASGETIVITDASLADFTYSLSGSTLTFTGGTLTLSGFFGKLSASAAAGGGVQLTAFRDAADARNDYNGDGRSDILWRHESGLISDWLGTASGGFANNHANAAMAVPIDWQIAGTGDFNGDGRDDILWRHDSGMVTDWLGTASGGFANNHANAAAAVPTDWRVAGTGDFNGDGRDDILWRHAGGTVSDWLGTASGGFANNHANAGAFLPTDWHIVGIGDFNGDGRDDILWRSDQGALTSWLGNTNSGFTPTSAAAVQILPNWLVAGIGDYNGDGIDDILWRSSEGALNNWLGTGGGDFIANDANAATTVPIDWHVQSPDIL